MKKATYDIVLCLLQSALWDVPLQEHLLPATEEEWQQVIEACLGQTVLVTVNPTIFSIRDEARRPSLQQQKLLRSYYYENLRLCQAHHRAIRQVFGAMEREGCHPILLKGQSNASYYKEPHLRCCGDIDIFVGPQEFAAAKEVLDSFATAEERAAVVAHPRSEHYEIVIHGLEFELHFHAGSTFGSERIKSGMLELEQQWLTPGQCSTMPLLDGEPVRVPDVHYQALFLFMHAWKHFSGGGIGLRHLADIALLLHRHHADLDATWLAAQLDQLQMRQAWITLMEVLVRYLGLPSESCPLHQPQPDGLSAAIWRRVTEWGNFGQSSHNVALTGIRRTIHYYVSHYDVNYVLCGSRIGSVAMLAMHMLRRIPYHLSFHRCGDFC